MSGRPPRPSPALISLHHPRHAKLGAMRQRDPSASRTRRRRLALALGGSLALHGLTLLWPRSEEPQASSSLHAPSPATVTWLEVAPAPEEPKARPAPVPDRPRPPSQVSQRTSAPLAVAPAPPRRPAAAAGAGSDRPVALVLTPRLAPTDLGSGADPAPGGGRTLHPGPAPDARELRAESEARGQARVEGWLASDLGAARVRGGLPDPVYEVLGGQLRAATREVPAFIDTGSAREVMNTLVQDWRAGGERWGRTGQAYDEPEGRRAEIEAPSAAATPGSPFTMGLLSKLAQGARLQEFADGRAGAGIFALVELRLQPGGTVDSVTLLRSSGLAAFDTWVTEQARVVGVHFTFDGGTRDRPLRSVWRFDGAIVYRQKVDPSKLDATRTAELTTKAVLSALTMLVGGPGQVGRFDEQSGALDMVDLSHPSYTCRVTLAEAD